MTEKGLVRRDEADRTHIYHPRLTEEQTQRQLIRDLMDRAFGGSSSRLVLQALASKRASSDELAEIRRMIEHGKESAKDRARETDTERDGRFVMNAIDQIRLLQQPAAQAIGWALLQFVWQGALVGASFGRCRFSPSAAAPPTSATSSLPSACR